MTGLKRLPPKGDLESKRVLRQLVRAHRSLAELKGLTATMANKYVLINAIIVNEAKDSSEIENIITTHDELYKAMSVQSYMNPAAKEVVNYRRALWNGYEQVMKKQVLTTNMLIEIQEIIEKNRAGIRKLPGTVLKNEATGEIIYAPPDSESEILALLGNLETYMNNDDDGTDPLVKLAVIHYQFEAIHPFYDGNGRTGRIMNILYLVLKGLLDSPLLYLSKYIIRNKTAYYHLLNSINATGEYEEWILYMLEGIEQTAEETILLIRKINQIIEETSIEIKSVLPKIYSKELVDLLFYEFYTKIDYIAKGLGVTRKTASGYLSALEESGFIHSQKIGKERIYLNNKLFSVVKQAGLER